jgi:hypothetical protein
MNISRIYFLGNRSSGDFAEEKRVLLPGIGQEVTNCKLRRILQVTG